MQVDRSYGGLDNKQAQFLALSYKQMANSFWPCPSLPAQSLHWITIWKLHFTPFPIGAMKTGMQAATSLAPSFYQIFKRILVWFNFPVPSHTKRNGMPCSSSQCLLWIILSHMWLQDSYALCLSLLQR